MIGQRAVQVSPAYQLARVVVENLALKASARGLESSVSIDDVKKRAQECDEHNPEGLWVAGSSYPPKAVPRKKAKKKGAETSEEPKANGKITGFKMTTICDHAANQDARFAPRSTALAQGKSTWNGIAQWTGGVSESIGAVP